MAADRMGLNTRAKSVAADLNGVIALGVMALGVMSPSVMALGVLTSDRGCLRNVTKFVQVGLGMFRKACYTLASIFGRALRPFRLCSAWRTISPITTFRDPGRTCVRSSESA